MFLRKQYKGCECKFTDYKGGFVRCEECPYKPRNELEQFDGIFALDEIEIKGNIITLNRGVQKVYIDTQAEFEELCVSNSLTLTLHIAFKYVNFEYAPKINMFCYYDEKGKKILWFYGTNIDY